MEQGKFEEARSLSSQKEPDTAGGQDVPALAVAKAFLGQYYVCMQNSREDAYNFYKEQSFRTHPCADGSMKSVTTRKGIRDEIMASNVRQWIPDLATMHAQDSVMDSVVVGVSGILIDNSDMRRNFSQTFFLVPQEGGGFYVHNDFLQIVKIITKPVKPPPPRVADLLTAQQANDTEKDDSLETAEATNKDETGKSTSKTEDGAIKNKVSASSKGKSLVLAEPKKKGQSSVWQPIRIMKEEAKQVSYASILAKEGSGSSSAPRATNPVVKVLEKPDNQTTVSPAAPKPSVFPVKPSMPLNSGPSENIYDVKAVWIKNLPPKMTLRSLLEVVRQFGPVKQHNIQIKANAENGYRFAFVEFDYPKSARDAVEARYINFEDRVSEIHYKKVHNQGGYNYAGRPPYGRGGYRNDGEGNSSGGWGHGHYEHHNPGPYYGQTRDYNYWQNRYSQAHY